MRHFFLFRLCLDFITACLLLAAMAYNWTGNVVHEAIGTAMFALLIAHNIFNRRWYGTVAKGRREARGLATQTINLSLLGAMVALIVTSVMISQTVFSFLPVTSTFTARQVHTMVAYLAMIVAAIHLGLHWTLIMSVLRGQLGIWPNSRTGLFAIRVTAGAIAAIGLYSLFAVDVGSKLMMRMTMDIGSFETPTISVLVHHIAIVGLFACLGHYAMKVRRARP